MDIVINWYILVYRLDKKRRGKKEENVFFFFKKKKVPKARADSVFQGY